MASMTRVLSTNSTTSDDDEAIAMENDRLSKNMSTCEHWDEHYAKNAALKIASSTEQSSNETIIADVLLFTYVF